MCVIERTVVEVKLNRGFVAFIDSDDIEMVNLYNWNVMFSRRTQYALTLDDFGHRLLMHRQIIDAPRGTQVDHVNGNGLDNRRCNLRFATAQQNAANAAKPRISGCTSIYKGVYLELSGQRKKRWRAGIRVDSKRIHLGSFATEAEAAVAYNKAATEHFGEYARLNFDN